MSTFYIIGGLSVLCFLLLWALIHGSKKRGQAEHQAEVAENTVKAVERGAKGAAEAKTAIRKGKTPQEVKDGNDARW